MSVSLKFLKFLAKFLTIFNTPLYSDTACIIKLEKLSAYLFNSFGPFKTLIVEIHTSSIKLISYPNPLVKSLSAFTV